MNESNPTKVLREALVDWTDADGAAYSLAECMGLMPPWTSSGWLRTKHVFWSNNPVGNMLDTLLDQLVAAGVLEKRDDPDYQYRWNAAFRGSWE
jgi:hypothetical protein